ncbi:MAG: hypothetical protein ABL914_00910 [Novosphingobium sp.]|uniref:hypothetical protein n=1 Tax=Novosphingobium sp. TaxID=1874826 RepID=UPI0032B9D827
MRAIAIALSSMLLLGAGFPASKYVVAASFTSALVKNDLKTARTFLVAKPKLLDWTGSHGTLQELATWMQTCPISSIEGNKDLNINVYLECPDERHGMSLHFTGNKIREVGFGPPPPRINLTPAGSN